MTKRDFLRSFTGLAALPFTPLHSLLQTIEGLPADTVAREEAFWESLRSHFTVTNDFIHLENGYYILAANEVMDALVSHARTVNRVSSYYMRTRQFDDKLAVRKQLAEVVGCSSDELIITRNTTESLDTVISGIDWKRGDEAVMAVQDYGAMLDMFAQQARRYGIVNREVELPNHPQSDDKLVRLYEKAITPKTRLLMLCHIVNITGQILPVRKIADMAHRHGVEVMVDGAHAVGHFDFRLPDLGCDYYGSSLHKWLGCPLGAGMLYVRRDKVKGLWPMFGDAGFADDDIRKLNHTGTHPVHTDLALADAIRFHQMIGIARKEARLRYLQAYWTSKVRSVPNVIVNTPADPARMCGIANVGIRGMKPTDLAKTLFDRYRIWTVGIERANVQGVRVTPHLYTTTAELDTLVKALRELAA
ncbi:aminotransferase class V-fold PLP-dependent enzyme [Rudanella paleaurantiibacter]|uniref:Aminotransferase class V-fold PLP-dependent enzyme n=1 Tax=Rudanella paleaurantiibacter TaxID=2614655 RepID=A0A7J5U6H7_9BACT|nr:aminotransferase class V-fold PLP-dependent enzyme [Rudanella paleaurantiibacter]KAB7733261.1 aminotransferase class V-fold PLP-dependent enzyme [Rudanella paleaurantiibacter]